MKLQSTIHCTFFLDATLSLCVLEAGFGVGISLLLKSPGPEINHHIILL